MSGTRPRAHSNLVTVERSISAVIQSGEVEQEAPFTLTLVNLVVDYVNFLTIKLK